MFAPDPPVRKRGCQSPLSIIQLLTAACYVLLTTTALVAISVCASPGTGLILSLAIYASLSFLCIISYFYSSLVDVTSLQGGLSCPCMAATQDELHFDRQTGAQILGFDHYCVFLNVCICRQNYASFYIMAASGAFQFVWQCVSLSLIAGGPWRKDGLSDGLIAFAAVMALLGVAGVATFGTLCFFHT